MFSHRFDRQMAPVLTPCVYVAVSPRLQTWARDNRQHYLFKVGYCRASFDREDYLNGRRARRGEWRNVDPCLGFGDWEIVPSLSFFSLPRARTVERQVKACLRRAFESFDPALLIGDRVPANGETEIFRIRPDQLQSLNAIVRTACRNLYVAPNFRIVVNAALREIMRLESDRQEEIEKQRRREPQWDDGLDEDGDEDMAAAGDGNHAALSFDEDIEDHARANEEGWAYRD
jgi:hypothetical protein